MLAQVLITSSCINIRTFRWRRF